MVFWLVVDISNHGDQISNSHKSKGGACPRGRGWGRVEGSVEQCAIFKSQEDMPYGLNVRIVRGFTCLVSICESFLATGELGILRYNKKFLNSLKSKNRASVLKIWHHIDNMRLFNYFRFVQRKVWIFWLNLVY